MLLLLFWSCVPVGGIVTLCQAALSPPGALLSQVSTAQGWQATTRAELALLGLAVTGIGVLIPLLLWPSMVRRPAQSVVWDERGVEVTKCYGGAITLGWEELLGLTQFRRHGFQPSGVLAAARGGRSFGINGWGSGYGELVDALKAHIWTRDEDGEGDEPGGPPGAGPVSGEPQQPECE